MNYKISLAALAVASIASGQAMAVGTGALSTGENTILAALAPDATWTTANNWDTSLDSTALTNTADWADGVDECTWRGVVCDAGGNITHIEIPNSGLSASMGDTLAALAPTAGTLVVMNLSTTAAPANVLAGDMTALPTFTALTHLALNGSSIAGVFPDMTPATTLNWVNIYTNPGLTGLAGKVAGGSAITLLGAQDNANLSGDMTPTLANISSPATITLNDSKLYGSVNWTSGDTMALANSDVVAVGGTTGDHGYDETAVVQAASGVTVTPGEETATISWVEPTVGAQTGYNVSYSTDDGATLEGTTAIAAGVATHTFTNVPAAPAYQAVVQSTGPDSRMASQALSADFEVTAGITDPVDPVVPTCADGETLNETTNECETTSSGGGGGAALWLVMLPLMGLLRRKRTA